MAATYGGGTFVSTDLGESWTVAKTGLGGDYVASLAVVGTNIFAGISGTGAIFRTTDDGNSWTGVYTGMNFYAFVQVLAAGPTHLYAGPQGLAVWRRPLADVVVAIPSSVQGSPEPFLLEQNYPNPFNPSTAVRYQLPAAGHVKLAVYDVLGREVAMLVSENKGREPTRSSSMPPGCQAASTCTG